MQSTPLTTAQDILQSAAPSRLLLTLLQTAKEKLAALFFVSSELQVQQFTRNGEVSWYAFDPKTGRQVFADTETELRIWIETTYQGK